MSLLDRSYRWSLRALPEDLRAEFGDEMAQLFRDQHRARSGRPIAVFAFWCAALADVAKSAIDERRQAFRLPSWRSLMRGFFSDAKHGFRLLRRYPASSILAIATLAIGIGANTAIFSVVDAVLVKQLPYADPGRLVMVWEKRPREGTMTGPVSPADYLDWRQRNTVLDRMSAFAETATSIVGDGEPINVPAAAVGSDFFDLLGVKMERGRTFTRDDELPGRSRVAILSHGLWKRRYGADPSIVGRTIVLNGNPWEVIGVLPATFRFAANFDVWGPLSLEGGPNPPPRASHQLQIYARLKPSVSMAQAVDAMDHLGKDLEREHPDTNTGHGANVTSMRDTYVQPYRTSLTVIFAAVGLVLLIGCVNVANLLLARAATRRREMGVRSALGATRARLVTQALVESISLAIVGGVLGIAVAVGLVQLLPAVLPAQLSVVELAGLSLDLRVLLFAFLLSLVTGVLFGVLPALNASKPDVADVLKESGRAIGGIRKRARLTLVIGEVALAALTLVGAGLVVRSFAAIWSQPLGFNPENRLTFSVSIPPARYDTPEKRALALAAIEQRLSTIPGVQSVGGIQILPLGGGDARQGVVIDGREVKPDDPPTRMHPRIATPSYFATMEIPIVRGRAFTAQDTFDAEPVVIINETAARRFWPNDDPIGKRVSFTNDKWRTIVGIARDVRHWGLTAAVNPMLYWPQAQARTSSLTFVLRTHSADSASLAGAARAQVASVDNKLPLGNVRTLDDVVSESVRGWRAQTVLIGAFAALALLLAIIGIYGVMSQLVVTRAHEIGVRMTLGARPFDVLRQLLAEGLWQSLSGLAIGLVAGGFVMKLANTMLFETPPWDPITLAVVSVLLITAALLACLVPARRAMRVDPVEALRQT